jgi:hypothetical protein
MQYMPEKLKSSELSKLLRRSDSAFSGKGVKGLVSFQMSPRGNILPASYGLNELTLQALIAKISVQIWNNFSSP